MQITADPAYNLGFVVYKCKLYSYFIGANCTKICGNVEPPIKSCRFRPCTINMEPYIMYVSTNRQSAYAGGKGGSQSRRRGGGEAAALREEDQTTINRDAGGGS